MWQIVNAELRYNRFYLATAFLATIGMWFAYVFDPAGLFQLFAVPAFFFMAAIFHFAIRERRERFFALIPVAPRQRSLALLLPFAILLHAAIVTAWAVQFYLASTDLANEYISIIGVLALNGITMCIVFLMSLRFNLNVGNRKYRWLANLFWGIVLLGGILLFFSFKISFQQNPEFYIGLRHLIFHSPAVAVAANAIGGGLMYFNATVYARRRSYLA